MFLWEITGFQVLLLHAVLAVACVHTRDGRIAKTWFICQQETQIWRGSLKTHCIPIASSPSQGADLRTRCKHSCPLLVLRGGCWDRLLKWVVVLRSCPAADQ